MKIGFTIFNQLSNSVVMSDKMSFPEIKVLKKLEFAYILRRNEA